jgi:O-antigen ligase
VSSAATLPRADAPRATRAEGILFHLPARTDPRPPLEFWTLQAYLFFQLSLLDEILPSLERLRPRAALGAFTLLVALARLFFGRQGTPASAGVPAVPSWAWRGPQGPLPGAAVSRWLLFFVLASAASMLWAFDAGAAKEAFQEHLTALAGYLLIVVLVKTRRQLLWTALTLCTAGGVYLLWSFYEYKCGRMDYAQGVPRMIGAGITNADANSFGATIVFLLPLVIWVGAVGRSWILAVSALGYATLTAVCVFLTSSRAALMLLAANVPLLLVLLPRGPARWIGLGSIGAVAVVMAAGLTDAQKDRIASIFSSETYEKDQSTLGRIEGYRVGFRMLQDRPVLGVGPGNWSAYRRQRIDGDGLEAHNLLGQLVGTRGGAGGVAFLGYLVAAFLLAFATLRQRWRSSDPWDRAVGRLALVTAVTLLLLLVSGLAAHNLERPNWVWMPALLVAALRTRPESPLDEPEPLGLGVHR